MTFFQKIEMDTAGSLYRSAMPFGTYDKSGDLFSEYLMQGIATVVLLAGDEECMEKSGINLRAYYAVQGMNVLPLPCADFGIPGKAETARMVRDVLNRLGKGENIAVHCSAGIGRTGTFLACMAKEQRKLSGDEAISWIRTQIPGAVETSGQEDFVRRY